MVLLVQFWIGLTMGGGLTLFLFLSQEKEKRKGLRKVIHKEKKGIVVLGFLLVGITVWNIVTSTMAVLHSALQDGFAVPYSMGNVVMVPLEPYNACSRQVLHMSCLTTIIADPTVTATPIPMNQNLYPQLCEDVVSAQGPDNQKPEARVLLESASVRLCYQVNGVVGALVETETVNVDTKVQHRIRRYLNPSEAHNVAMAASSSSRGGYLHHRIVDRKTVAMRQQYKPYSKKNNKERESDPNRGNFLWQMGATRLMNPFTNVFVKYSKDEARLASAFVSAMANAIELDSADATKPMFKTLTSAIRRIDAPTIQLGVGIQKDYGTASDISEFKLFEFQKRYFAEIEKRQTKPAIAVHGELTRLTCQNSGISNCITMGCPSFTLNTDKDLGQKLAVNWMGLLSKLEAKEKLQLILVLPKTLGTGVTKAQWRRHGTLLQIYRQLSQIHNVTVVVQVKTDRDQVKESGLNEFAQRVMFSSGEEWFNFTGSADLVLSGRIQGGMAGIVSATPTVVIPTDLRMQELIETMLIPTLSLQTIQQQFDLALAAKGAAQKELLATLLNMVELDFRAFELNRRRLIVQYGQILREANLEMNPKLLQVIHGGD